MNEADRRALELATLDLHLTDDGYRELSECTAIGQAALLLSMDESALQAWYEGAPPPVGPISRVLSRTPDRDDVADRIDATLTEDPTVLADLCRAQITWSHPVLTDLLDEPQFRGPAAWMLAQTDPQPLCDWLDDVGEPDELVAVARHAAPSGIPEIFDALAPWHAPAHQTAPSTGATVEASLFVLSPEQWGRGFLRGDWSASFLHDATAMADIVAAAGQTYWSGALGVFDPASDEFGAIARMATAGAAANLMLGPDEPGRPLVDAFYQEEWDVLGTHPAFGVARVLAEESSWLQPLLEAAAHDVLLARAIDSPGIGGLPLSSSHPDADEINAARALAATDDDVDPIVLVATMCDILELRAVREFDGLPPKFAGFVEHPNIGVNRVARLLQQLPSLQTEREVARAETARGIAAAERIARRNEDDALLTLIDLWADGPVLRAGLYAALVHQELRALSTLR